MRVSRQHSASASHPAVATSHPAVASSHSAPAGNPAVATSQAPAHNATGNVAALKLVRSFDMDKRWYGTDYTTDAWTNYIARVQAASGMATDQTLSTAILQYYNDLQWNGASAYNGQALTTLINYGRAVYHINVFPGG